jgi:hypothetical protein
MTMRRATYRAAKAAAHRCPGGRVNLFGFEFSDHALDRMLERIPDMDDLHRALIQPQLTRVRSDGCSYQQYGDVAVVLAPASTVVKTVMTGLAS